MAVEMVEQGDLFVFLLRLQGLIHSLSLCWAYW